VRFARQTVMWRRAERIIMKHAKTIALAVIGVILALLGGLWLLQGLGLVTIAPIACVAECEPLEGPSPTWAAIGLVVFAAGLLTLFFTFQRRAPK
jgi:hypothetical protein